MTAVVANNSGSSLAVSALLHILIVVLWKGEKMFSWNINPLNTKHSLLYLKIHFVPHSKHFSSRL